MLSRYICQGLIRKAELPWLCDNLLLPSSSQVADLLWLPFYLTEIKLTILPHLSKTDLMSYNYILLNKDILMNCSKVISL